MLYPKLLEAIQVEQRSPEDKAQNALTATESSTPVFTLEAFPTIFNICFMKVHVTALINYEYFWKGEKGRNSQFPCPYSGFYTGTK
jgi:hypothetical protein